MNIYSNYFNQLQTNRTVLEAYKTVYKEDFLRQKQNRNMNKLVIEFNSLNIYLIIILFQDMDRSKEYETTFHVKAINMF